MRRERENMQDINDDKPEKPATATTATTATTAIKARKEPGHKEDTHKPNMDSSKEAGKGTIGAVGAGCDKGCDKCSMEMPKKKNIFNEMAVDNFVPYITEENLLAAQTNIIDVYNYNLCINNDDIETLDVKRGPLCDIQGLQDIPDLGDNKRLRGYDTYHSRLGNLTYDIL
jgi:ribosomal protein S26